MPLPTFNVESEGTDTLPVEALPVSRGQGMMAGVKEGAASSLMASGITRLKGALGDQTFVPYKDAAQEMQLNGYDANVLPKGGLSRGFLDALKDQQSALKRNGEIADDAGVRHTEGWTPSARGMAEFAGGSVSDSPFFMLGGGAMGMGLRAAGVAAEGGLIGAGIRAGEGATLAGAYDVGRKEAGTAPGDKDLGMYDFARDMALGGGLGLIGAPRGKKGGADTGVRGRMKGDVHDDGGAGDEFFGEYLDIAGNPAVRKFVVGRRLPSGKVIVGKPGENHADLLRPNEETAPDEQMGFVTPDGKFLTRAETGRLAGAPRRSALPTEESAAAFIKGKYPDAVITSGFRTVAHNAEIGGAKGSLHTRGTGQAADVVLPKGVKPAEFRAELEKAGLPVTEFLVEKKGDAHSTGDHVHWGWGPKDGRLEPARVANATADLMQDKVPAETAPKPLPRSFGAAKEADTDASTRFDWQTPEADQQLARMAEAPKEQSPEMEQLSKSALEAKQDAEHATLMANPESDLEAFKTHMADATEPAKAQAQLEQATVAALKCAVVKGFG